MQFNKEQIQKLADQARMGPQKKISVDLKRVKKEALFLQREYMKARQEGPVSSFDFLLHWEKEKETKYLCSRVRSLAKIISVGQFNKEKFEFMMNMGAMVERGRMREYDASVMVGQKFANEYIAPVHQQQQQASNVTTSSPSTADKDT